MGDAVSELQTRGVEVTAPELPLKGFADDIAAARGSIEAAGDDLVVCGHSYGGSSSRRLPLTLHRVGTWSTSAGSWSTPVKIP